jgi:hypothetical protein
METNSEYSNVTKQRHGCVAAWLIFIIISNSIAALFYLFASELIAKNLPGDVPTSTIIVLGIVTLTNVFFAYLIFQWKKYGFWGLAVTSFCGLLINFDLGFGMGESLYGLAGIAILYGILQIKKGNGSGWENLE